MFLGGHTVAMVTYCVTKMITTCSPMIKQLSNFTIAASISSHIDSSKYSGGICFAQHIRQQVIKMACCAYMGWLTIIHRSGGE